jgi:hypothetical protein
MPVSATRVRLSALLPDAARYGVAQRGHVHDGEYAPSGIASPCIWVFAGLDAPPEQVGAEKPLWRTDPAVIALAAKLDVPADILLSQTFRSIYSDSHTQFLIRVWYGPATSPDQM